MIKKLTLTLGFIAWINFSFGQSTYFKANESHHYKFVYLNPQKDTVAKGDILIKPTDNKWKYDASQKAVVYEYTFHKREEAYFKEGEHGLAITKDLKETTGYAETDRSFWMHPFRTNIFYITEIAPFPYYTKGNGIVKTKTILQIDPGWGKFQGTSKRNYKVSKYKGDHPKYSASQLKQVKMKAKHKLGKSYLKLLVSDEIGIIEFNYKFFNKDRLIITKSDK